MYIELQELSAIDVYFPSEDDTWGCSRSLEKRIKKKQKKEEEEELTTKTQITVIKWVESYFPKSNFPLLSCRHGRMLRISSCVHSLARQPRHRRCPMPPITVPFLPLSSLFRFHSPLISSSQLNAPLSLTAATVRPITYNSPICRRGKCGEGETFAQGQTDERTDGRRDG